MNELEKMFLEGFKISGEGWNGEYPHEGRTDEEIWDKIKLEFKNLKGGKIKDDKTKRNL